MKNLELQIAPIPLSGFSVTEIEAIWPSNREATTCLLFDLEKVNALSEF